MGAVHFTGWQKQLERIYADLDLVLLTSINEGTPVSLLEAMASGKPIVSTDAGGVRDLMVGPATRRADFEVFQNGILTPRDDRVLAQAVAYLMENSELRRAMGQAGRSFVQARFSSQRLAEIWSLFTSLWLARKGFCPCRRRVCSPAILSTSPNVRPPGRARPNKSSPRANPNPFAEVCSRKDGIRSLSWSSLSCS